MADSKRICSVADCNNPSRKRGWCTKHYQRWQVHGDPEKTIRKRNKCSVDGCENNAASGGLCGMHHMRMKRHGSTDKRGAENGELFQYIVDVALNHDSDECLYWPYNNASRGAGLVRYNGKSHRAPRLVCELAHGPAPESDELIDTAHSCGNGHLGCLNPKHLRWATRKENQADRVEHGTAHIGASHPLAKLREDQVKWARDMRGKMPQSKIAKALGVCQSHISAIQAGAAWGHIQ